MKRTEQYIWTALRLALGFILLWAFFDKLFGLGFSTASDKSWLAGVSPTTGYLKFGTHGAYASFFQSLAGNPLVDWSFMLGLLGIGLAMVLGICLSIGGFFGVLFMFLLWLSQVPPQTNPFIDEHVVYMIIFLGIALLRPADVWSLKTWWKRTKLVKKYPFLA